VFLLAKGDAEGSLVQIYAECAAPSYSWVGWILWLSDGKLRRGTEQECCCNCRSVKAYFHLFYHLTLR